MKDRILIKRISNILNVNKDDIIKTIKKMKNDLKSAD